MWRLTEETLGSGRIVGAHFHEVVNHRQRREFGLGQAVMAVMEEAQMTVAALDSRARTLEELGALLDEMNEHQPVVVAQW